MRFLYYFTFSPWLPSINSQLVVYVNPKRLYQYLPYGGISASVCEMQFAGNISGLIWVRAQSKNLSELGIHIWGARLRGLCLPCQWLRVVVWISGLYKDSTVIKGWWVTGRRSKSPKVVQCWSPRATELWLRSPSCWCNILFTTSCWHKQSNWWHLKYLAINFSCPGVQQIFPCNVTGNLRIKQTPSLRNKVS